MEGGPEDGTDAARSLFFFFFCFFFGSWLVLEVVSLVFRTLGRVLEAYHTHDILMTAWCHQDKKMRGYSQIL